MAKEGPAATALGLGSVWLGILYLMKGEFMAVIPIGYGSAPAKGPKKLGTEQIARFLP